MNPRHRNPLNLALDVSADAIDAPPLLFLACPYSHPDVVTRIQRAGSASDVAARLMAAGYAVFWPISHGHAICYADACIGTDAPAWAGVNDAVLPVCHALVALDIDGLWDSAGVRREVALAARFGLPINLVRVRADNALEAEPDIDPMLFSDKEGKL